MADLLKRPLDAQRDFLLGDPQAKTKLIWYVDYTFQPARRARDILRRSVHRFGREGAVIAIRQNPLPHRAPESEIAARAAVAAGWQGKFMDMHDALFAHEHAYDKAAVIALAERIGLDLERFTNDLNARETVERVEQDRATVVDVGYLSAPLLFINNRLYKGAWDEDALIEALEKPLGVKLRLASTDFFEWAASAGLVLVLATIAALAFVNLGGYGAYEHIRGTLIGLSYGERVFTLPVMTWINDGLMAIFFLVVGIEIKRELLTGELSDPRRAALPFIGAIGGMAMPALIYAAFNWGRDTIVGWGVPMATDIAFTLGLMALLGRRVPTSLKVFVSALAIVDDLGAIIVIALFYSEGVHISALVWAAGVFAVMLGLNRARVYSSTPYLILGLLLWGFIHESGLHATLAGVLTAFAVPSRRSGDVRGIAAQTAVMFDAELRRTDVGQDEPATVRPTTLRILENALTRLREPGYHLQHRLENWSNFLILPLFAFFNVGIRITGSGLSLNAPESLGVIAGLVVGKPLGILLACWLGVRLRVAALSSEIRWMQMLGAGALAGVGFTMSIFIAATTFEDAQLEMVKLSILLASILSAAIGATILFTAAKT